MEWERRADGKHWKTLIFGGEGVSNRKFREGAHRPRGMNRFVKILKGEVRKCVTKDLVGFSMWKARKGSEGSVSIFSWPSLATEVPQKTPHLLGTCMSVDTGNSESWRQSPVITSLLATKLAVTGCRSPHSSDFSELLPNFCCPLNCET